MTTTERAERTITASSGGIADVSITFRKPRFSADDADRAHDEWGCNCGPGALAAITGRTLDEVRPHLNGFDEKRYTNPTMMFDALDSLGVRWQRGPTIRGRAQSWPMFGLCRVQWEGPWTEPDVPKKWGYRYTHWVGAHSVGVDVGIFDINAVGNGSGWCSLADWMDHIVPALTANYKRASGCWHLTHSLEVRP